MRRRYLGPVAGVLLVGAVAFVTGEPVSAQSGADGPSAGPVPSARTAADQDPDLPTAAELMAPFRDMWGTNTFEDPQVTSWVNSALYKRVGRLSFAPGRDETSGRPQQVKNVAAKQLQIMTRTNKDTPEYQVIEDSSDGSPNTANRFPVFEGKAQSFVFYNSVTDQGEYQETCRLLKTTADRFLVCRVLTADHQVHYDLSVPTEEELNQPLPPTDQILEPFKDLWGETSFEPTGVGPWKVESEWTRMSSPNVLSLEPQKPGTTELNATSLTFGDPSHQSKGLQEHIMRRTTPHGVEHQLITWTFELDDISVVPNYFPVYEGDGKTFTFHNRLTTAGDFKENCALISKAGTDYEVCRTMRPDTQITYQYWTRQN